MERKVKNENKRLEGFGNDEIFDVIKNNLKNDKEYKVNFGYMNGFYKSKVDNSQKLFKNSSFNQNTSDSSEKNQFNFSSENSIPYVIINLSDDFSYENSSKYIAQIKENNKLGIQNLGYVTTNEYMKNINKVYSEIDKYMEFLGENYISGIFFDELSSGKDLSEVKYMSQLYHYVKTKYPDLLIVGNPGGTITDEMSKYADLWLTSEVSADDYINNWTSRTYEFENNPANANHIVHVIHSAKPEQYETLINLSKERNAGFLMIINTDENMENKNLIEKDNLDEEKLGLKFDSELVDKEILDFDKMEIIENNENISHQFVLSGKYNIIGNLKISDLDLFTLLSDYYKNGIKTFSKRILNNNFDFGYNILDEFKIDYSYKIIDEIGNFEIKLIKNRNSSFFYSPIFKNLTDLFDNDN